jgi:hypothetical protein
MIGTIFNIAGQICMTPVLWRLHVIVVSHSGKKIDFWDVVDRAILCQFLCVIFTNLTPYCRQLNDFAENASSKIKRQRFVYVRLVTPKRLNLASWELSSQKLVWPAVANKTVRSSWIAYHETLFWALSGILVPVNDGDARMIMKMRWIRLKVPMRQFFLWLNCKVHLKS